MADFTVDITPAAIVQGGEASLDTSILNGVSAQRTVEMLLVRDAGDPTKVKMVGKKKDGDVFNDTVEDTDVLVDFYSQ